MPRRLAFVDLEREREVGRQLVEKAQLFLVEEPRFPRVEVERADDARPGRERQRRHGAVFTADRRVAPRRGAGVAGDVVAHPVRARAHRLVGPDTSRVGAAVAEQRTDHGQRVLRAAGVRGNPQAARRLVHHPDPRHPEPALLDGNPAGRFEQRLRVALADDGLVDVAEHRVDPVGMLGAPLGFLPLRDVLVHARQVEGAAGLVPRAPPALGHPADLTARQDDPELHGVLAGRPRPLDPAGDDGAVLGMDQRQQRRAGLRIERLGQARHRSAALNGPQRIRLEIPRPHAHPRHVEGGLELRRLVAQPRPCFPDGGDLDDGAAHPQRLACFVERELAAAGHPVDRAVGPDHAEFMGVSRTPGDGAVHRGAQRGQVLRMHAAREGLVGAVELTGRKSPQLLVGARPGDVVPRHVPVEGAHVRRIDGHAQAVGTFAGGFLRPLVSRDLAGDAEQRGDLPLLVAQRHGVGLQPAPGALDALDLELQRARFAVHDPVGQRRKCRAVRGHDQVEHRMPGDLRHRIRLDHPQAGGVHLEQLTRRPEQLHAFGLVLEHRPQPPLAGDELARLAAQLELGHHLPAERPERAFLCRGQLTGDAVENGQRPQHVPIHGDQRRAGVEADADLAVHERVAGKRPSAAASRTTNRPVVCRPGANKAPARGVSPTSTPIRDLNHSRSASTSEINAIGASQICAASAARSSSACSGGVSRTR